jgi:hypothetical protein
MLVVPWMGLRMRPLLRVKQRYRTTVIKLRLRGHLTLQNISIKASSDPSGRGQSIPGSRCSRMSTGAILDVSYQLHVDDRLEPGRPSLSERAPSPSDAALAKTSAGTDSQSLHNPNERYSYGENALRRLQNNHNNSKLPATTHIATGNENISHITRSAPLLKSSLAGPSR